MEVNDGVVTLSGTVRNPRSKPLAYADAFWSSGVVDVNNKIEIKPSKKRQKQEQGEMVGMKGGERQKEDEIDEEM